MENKSEELKIAIKAAEEAGKILQKYFETEILKEIKEDQSITTSADKESEKTIKEIILGSFPTHSILGEEEGFVENSKDYIWHIDPLDGTRNFSNGIPFFAISIALEYKKDLILGVIYNPIINSLFYAEKGKGSFFNHKQIFVSKDNEKRCMVTVASGVKKEDVALRRKLMYSLPTNVVSSVRDFGCTALDLAYVAKGNTEADIKFGLKTYDFAAGILIVKEAGGKITTSDGGDWTLGENDFIASNGVFHNLLVEEIKKQKETII